MLGNESLLNLINHSEIIQSLKNKSLSQKVISNFLESKNANTFEQQLDCLFDLFYNNFASDEITASSEFIYEVFLSVPAYMQNTSLLKEDENNDDIISQIETMKQIANTYAYLIVFINSTLNDNMMLLETKIEQLLKIDYNILPQSEAKKCYLYFLLNILLASPIKDIDLIASITEELRKFLD